MNSKVQCTYFNKPLSQKSRLGKILTGKVSDWKKLSANDCYVGENFEISVRRASGDRFTARDPIGFRGGDANLYVYALGDSINAIDTDGLLPSSCTATPQAAALCGEAGASGTSSASQNAGRWTLLCLLTGTCAANEDKEGDGESCPPLPDDYVGEQDDASGDQGNRHKSGPLAPEHGGTGDAQSDFDHLTGGTGRPAPSDSRYPPGTQIGDNGVTIRPGTNGKGPRIDIPSNGSRPHETLHY